MEWRDAILELLHERGPGKSICPSEAARRALPGDEWREAMEPVREAARLLASEGVIDVTQKGSVVDPKTARGAIRYRLRNAYE